jgi:hypothetical protein
MFFNSLLEACDLVCLEKALPIVKQLRTAIPCQDFARRSNASKAIFEFK